MQQEDTFNEEVTTDKPSNREERSQRPAYTVDDIELFRKVLSAEVKQDILSWFRGQFWIAGIVVTAISLLGLTNIMESIFENKISKFEEVANKALDSANTAAKSAAEKVENLEARSEELNSQFNVLVSQTSDLSDSIKSLQGNVESVRASSDAQITKSIEKLYTRIDGIETDLSEVALALSQVGADIDAEALASDLKERASETKSEITEISEKANVTVAVLLCNVDEKQILCNSNSNLLQEVSTEGYGVAPANNLYIREGEFWDNSFRVRRNEQYYHILSLLNENSESGLVATRDDINLLHFTKDIERILGIENAAYIKSKDLPAFNSDIIFLTKKNSQ